MPVAVHGNIPLAISTTEPRVTSKLLLIWIEYEYVVWVPHRADAVVRKWLVCMEVEYEKSRALLIDYELVSFVT